MPGPYAHITLLHELMRPARRKSIFAPSSGFEAALLEYFPFCTLGSVSPDYPNLAPAESGDACWADAMHYERACEMISSGISHIRNSHGAVRDKQLAWLLGYCAHVATDVTIHPLVQAKVGVYALNQRQHRICEMNQDSYIYHRMELGEIGESHYFSVAVTQCSESDGDGRLDSDIIVLWEAMLADVHPQLFAKHPPDTALWHYHFFALTAEQSTRIVRLFPLADKIARKMDLSYPLFNNVDHQFIEDQLVPAEEPLRMHYDDIFDHAAGSVVALWRQVERAVSNESADIPTFGDWNLDNGRDEHGRLVFWE